MKNNSVNEMNVEDILPEEEIREEKEKTEEEKKISMDTLIEKGKKGKLSADDLDEAMEEMEAWENKHTA